MQRSLLQNLTEKLRIESLKLKQIYPGRFPSGEITK